MCKQLLFILFTLVSVTNIHSQTNIEEKLRLEYEEATGLEEKWNSLFTLTRYYSQNNIVKADSAFVNLINLGKKVSPYAQFKSEELKADIDYIFGRKALYKNFYTSSSKYLHLTKNKQEKDDIKHAWAIGLKIDKKIDSALILTRQILTSAKNRKDYDLAAKGLLQLGALLAKKDKIDSTFICFEEGLNYAKRAKYKRTLTKLHNNLANAYRNKAMAEKSLQKQILAMEIASKNNLGYSEAMYANKVGRIQKRNNNLEEALYYYKISAEICEKINENRLRAMVYGNIGNTLKDLKQYKEALTYHKKAIELNKVLESEKGLGDAYTNTGIVYNRLKEYQQAIKNYKIALTYFEKINNNERVSRALHNMGNTYYQMGEPKKALPILNRALKIKLDNNFRSVISTYDVLSKVHSETNNFEKAYEYITIVKKFTDSVHESETREKIANLSTQYRAEKNFEKIQEQREKIERQKQEKEIRLKDLENTELKNNQKTYIIIGILLIALLLMSVGFARYKQARLREERKEAELNQSLLRTQMNPHFVFNAMSVIQSYIYDNDVKNSSRFLVNFSKLMRLILENSPKEFIPISVEQDILNKYLVVQKLRFEDRFDFEINIDPSLIEKDAMIPPMLTQPFIENAIEHGELHECENDGLISIYFKEKGTNLMVEIIDNGIGRDKANANKKASAHKSMAMKITKERINLMNTKYKSDGLMKVEDADPNKKIGTHVTLIIPLKLNLQTEIT